MNDVACRGQKANSHIVSQGARISVLAMQAQNKNPEYNLAMTNVTAPGSTYTPIYSSHVFRLVGWPKKREGSIFSCGITVRKLFK